MLSLDAARELEERGKQPRVRMDSRSSSGKRSKENMSMGTFIRVEGNKILCKPVRHGGRVEKFSPSEISLWTAENANDTEVQKIDRQEKAKSKTINDRKYVLIDLQSGLACNKDPQNGNNIFLAQTLDHVLIYETDGKQKALMVARTALKRIKNNNNITGTDHLKVVNLDKARKIIESCSTKGKKQKEDEDDKLQVQMAQIEITEQNYRTNLKWVERFMDGDVVEAAEDVVTSNTIKSKIVELTTLISDYESKMAITLTARQKVEDGLKDLVVSILNSLKTSSEILRDNKPAIDDIRTLVSD